MKKGVIVVINNISDNSNTNEQYPKKNSGDLNGRKINPNPTKTFLKKVIPIIQTIYAIKLYLLSCQKLKQIEYLNQLSSTNHQLEPTKNVKLIQSTKNWKKINRESKLIAIPIIGTLYAIIDVSIRYFNKKK